MDSYSVLGLALTGLALIMFGGMWLAHRHESQTRPAPEFRMGIDPSGATWAAQRTGPDTLCILRNGRIWVTACGPMTLSSVTLMHDITWSTL